MTEIQYPQIPIAIIGMGCMFAKSSALKDFWRLIVHGEDGIDMVPDTHWSASDYYDKNPKRPDHVYCRRGGYLPPVSFDPTEFGIPPANLEATDSSQLLSLLTAKAALKDAGYLDGKPFDRDRTSVILGATGTQELAIPLGARLGHPHWRRALQAADIPAEKIEHILRDIAAAYVPWQENSFPGLLGNVVAGRICNRLDLGGTNCVVDAACASSMSALHLSLLELAAGRSDMVLAGGVDLLNDIFMHMCFSSTFILSPTEDIRPFSKDADGTLLGEGLGMLVLKRLPDAERDADRIYALIRGLGTSSDGRSQSIYAPRTEGQEKALRTAYLQAGIFPETVELIEAHGTGTRVGDQVEFQTLKTVFGHTVKNGYRCALGSVKSQIGHAKAAAGSAGLIKTALALYHKVLPPTLKAKTADPKLGIEESPFYLNRESRPWVAAADSPRRAGVSSFGFGGSNFHAVLEEYRPQKEAVSWDGTVEILAFSAPTHDQLKSQLNALIKTVKAGWTPIDLAVEAHDSRKRFSPDAPFRLLMAIEMPHDGAEKLAGWLTSAADALRGNPPNLPWQLPNIFYGTGPVTGKLAILFPGQGSQYTGMGKDLICTFPEALAVLVSAEHYFRKANPHAARLSDIIFPFDADTPGKAAEAESCLRSTDNAQPAIGAVSLAMWRVLQRFNIRPDVTGGHSFGELTALCAAGWCDEASLHTLSIHRGQCMAAASKGKDRDAGTMMAVIGPLNELSRRLEESRVDVVLANRNSPEQGVLSGPAAAITLAETKCRDWGFKTKRLPVSAAFHSPLMEAACRPFESALAGIHFTPTDVTVYANTSGRPYSKNPATARKRLRDQLIKPVEFINNIQNMNQDGVQTFLEVGPKTVLAGLCRSILKDADVSVLSLDGSSGRRKGLLDLAIALCRMAALGYSIALDQWEDPVTKPAAPKMQVTLTGANYRSRKPDTLNATAHDIPALSEPVLPVLETIPDKMEKTINDTQSAQDTSAAKRQAAPPSPHTAYQPAAYLENALRVAEQGLKSMQALQMKTAEAHQKFLDTQAEAGRALKEMMDSARQMTGFMQGPGAPPFRTISREKAPEAENTIPAVNAALPANTPPPAPAPVSNAKSFPPAVMPEEQQAPAIEKNSKNDVAAHLLAVVSKLTGYPEDMLNLDMDIESDLGIDSIKRVEILSTLEESLPGLPPVQPEVMGRLKTLRQIVSHLAATCDETGQGISKREPASTSPADLTSDTRIRDALLAVVSKLTGYPEDMLNLDMDIESDLGIDSIKRVEILSTLEESLPGLPAVQPEAMGRLKTLGQMVQHLSAPAQADAPPKPTPSTRGDIQTGKMKISPEDPAKAVARSVVRLQKSPFPSVSPAPIDPNRVIYITAEASGLSEALAAAFGDLGQPAQTLSANRVREILTTTAFPADACGLVLMPDASALSENGMDFRDIEFLKSWFLLARYAAPVLMAAAENRPALFATISFLDGAFGFGGKDVAKPAQGALAGLVKTAAIEWEGMTCRAIDVSPDWPEIRELGARIAAELMDESRRHQTETGFTPDGRISIGLSPAPLTPDNADQSVLTSSDVFVVTGGARGVTAAAAYALAQTAKPVLILIGRSEPPFLEPGWLTGLTTASEIKKAIMDHEFNRQAPSPRAVEAVYARYMANREMTHTLDRINATGAQVRYFQADVRHEAEMTAVLENVRAIYGPITGILHGAGVLEDRLIVDKTPEQITRVFETKIKGAQHLLACTKADPLRYIVFFSSVAARFGNRGQADYAMANEMLNKIAARVSIQRPSCRTISINWGPWEGGMVTDALKREFLKRGIDLIPLQAGARCLVKELMRREASPAEILLGADFREDRTSIAQPPASGPAPSDLSLLFKREIDVQRLPVLQSHQLDGIPVVPFALIAEWIGHGAMHGNPGLHLHGLDDMRLLKGIRLQDKTKMIRLMAGKAQKKGDVFEVDVEIRNGVKDGKDVIHSRARAVLSPNIIKAPIVSPTLVSQFPPYSKSVEEIYETILFHGVDLQGLKQIIGLSEHGMAARIAAAPTPETWMANPMRTRWISDPLALDGAFQMACIWCYEHLGAVSLPSYTAAYRQFCREFPKDGVTAVLEVTSQSRHKMTGNFTFVDAENIVVATLSGYEAIVDDSLFKSFKPDKIAG